MTKKKIKDLGRFEVFSFNGVNWVWPDKLGRDNVYECDSVDYGAILYVGEYSDDMNKEVELLGRMEFIRTGP